MAKLTRNQNAIIAILTEYHELLTRSTTIGAADVRDELVIDTKHNHFQLVTLGWQQQRFFHETNIHIDIFGQKIWIQQNNTEFDIVEELLARGIAASDIVLGFIAPSVRKDTGFAVA